MDVRSTKTSMMSSFPTFSVVRLTGLWKHLASEREKPLMEGCLTIPQIREQVWSFNMTSSDFSSCRSISSLTINIFELPPIEQCVFNCASHVVLSNGTLSYSKFILFRRSRTSLWRASCAGSPRLEATATPRSSSTTPSRWDPTSTPSWTRWSQNLLVSENHKNCQLPRSGPATTATASLATTYCSTPAADLIWSRSTRHLPVTRPSWILLSTGRWWAFIFLYPWNLLFLDKRDVPHRGLPCAAQCCFKPKKAGDCVQKAQHFPEHL